MKLGGFETNNWKPLTDGRSKSPDGTPDRFMVRNVSDPNRAKIMFTNVMGRRIITLELTNNVILARITQPK